MYKFVCLDHMHLTGFSPSGGSTIFTIEKVSGTANQCVIKTQSAIDYEDSSINPSYTATLTVSDLN